MCKQNVPSTKAKSATPAVTHKPSRLGVPPYSQATSLRGLARAGQDEVCQPARRHVVAWHVYGTSACQPRASNLGTRTREQLKIAVSGISRSEGVLEDV